MRRRVRVWSRTARLAGVTVWRLGRAEILARGVAPDRRPEIFARELDRWANESLAAFGVELDLAPGPPGAVEGAHIIVANHRSFLDIPLFLALFRGRHLSRGDVADWPIVGHAAKRIGTVFVDRGDEGSGARAVRALRRALQQGDTLIVFPEGGTHAGDEVRPFRAGALVAARSLPVTITPVGVAYPAGLDWSGLTFGDHLDRLASRPALPVAVEIGPPRRLEGPTRAVNAALQEEVQGLVRRARERLREGGAVE